jgi:hypothetical protein
MKAYLALVKRSGGPSGGSNLHLIREDAEASLCGIPRSLLTGAASSIRSSARPASSGSRSVAQSRQCIPL